MATLSPALVLEGLPAAVRNELIKLPAQTQAEFLGEYKQRSKSLNIAYVLWIVCGLHYAYLGRWGMQLLFWVTGGGVGVWWIVDAVRMAKLVRRCNDKIAESVLENLQTR